MSINPFVYDDPLRPSDLIDRLDEARHMLNLAEGGHNTRLAAPRRYGKTTLLLKVIEDARGVGMNTVYVDFYRALTVPQVVSRLEDAYLRDLAGPLRRTVSNLMRTWRGKIQVAPGGIGGSLENVGYSDQERILGNLLDLPKKIYDKTSARTLVVFDEFQDLLKAETNIDGLIRTKIQHHRDEAAYIFAGSEPGMLRALFTDSKRPLFEQARPVELPPLPDDALADYVEARFEDAGRSAGAALDPLLDVVRGHPQRAMLLAHHLFEHTDAGATADEDTFAVALDAAERELKERFDATWQALAKTQRKTLVALAERSGSLYSNPTLERVGLARSSASEAITALKEVGEVHEVDGRPAIVDPLFERWLRS